MIRANLRIEPEIYSRINGDVRDRIGYLKCSHFLGLDTTHSVVLSSIRWQLEMCKDVIIRTAGIHFAALGLVSRIAETVYENGLEPCPSLVELLVQFVLKTQQIIGREPAFKEFLKKAPMLAVDLLIRRLEVDYQKG
jgi:hypothetical protein